jgi:mutator protein MutT
MYKFFINDKPLLLTSSSDLGEKYSNNPTETYMGEETLMEKVRKIEDQNQLGLNLICEDPSSVFQSLKSHFTAIHAGGGIVFNAKNQLLIMKRLGKWDLPKGKIDPGETNEEGALREVEEECGIDKLSIRNFFQNSYHTYKLQGHRFLKITHWFIMDSDFMGELIPQESEGITEVKWVNFEELDLNTLDSYESIRDILTELRKSLS